MSITMSDTVQALLQLPPEALHQENCAACASLRSRHWYLAAHLLATARSGLYKDKGYQHPLTYAVKELDLHYNKASELLRVAKACELLPAISEEFRHGLLGWRKVQEITRVAVPENELEWLEKARQYSAERLKRMVVISPHTLKRGRALREAKEARESQPELGFTDEPGTHQDSQVEGAADKETASAVRPESCQAVETALAAPPPSRPSPSPSRPSPPPSRPSPSPSRPSPPPVPEVEPLVNFTCRLTPAQLAVVEQALKFVTASNPSCRGRAKALAAMAERVMGCADHRSKVKYQVLIHVDAETGEGFLDTDRGLLKADSEVVEEAMKDGPVLVTGVEEEDERQLELLSDQDFAEGKTARTAVPIPVVRALFARARGSCEECGCRWGPFHIHHVRPWSRGGRHRLPELKLLCPGCHRATHKKDFEDDPAWRAARDRAMAARDHSLQGAFERAFERLELESG